MSKRNEPENQSTPNVPGYTSRGAKLLQAATAKARARGAAVVTEQRKRVFQTYLDPRGSEYGYFDVARANATGRKYEVTYTDGEGRRAYTVTLAASDLHAFNRAHFGKAVQS